MAAADDLGQVWQDVLGTQPRLSDTALLACAALALVTVWVRRLWRVTRQVVTIVHEGGHALVALMVGRRLAGIRLHSDTSGVTVSKGRPTGPGMVATAAAGYVAPSVLGLAYAAMLAGGRITALLWLSVALLAVMLVAIRNAYGVLAVLATGLGLFVVSWYAPARPQALVAGAFTWFLLLAAFRPLAELQRKRATGRTRDSDVDQLARLTRVPAAVWVALFALVAAGALVLAANWLLPVASVRSWIAGG